MMLEVSKLGVDKDYKKLKHITSSGTTVSLMYLVDDIYKNIIDDMYKSGKGGDKVWCHLNGLSCIWMHGYMEGIRSERKRKKVRNND